MDQEKQPYNYHSTEESPIPIPPIEDAWSMMKQQLDIHQPVTRHWALRLNKPTLWLGAAAAVATGALVIWLSGKSHSQSGLRHQSLLQTVTPYHQPKTAPGQFRPSPDQSQATRDQSQATTDRLQASSNTSASSPSSTPREPFINNTSHSRSDLYSTTRHTTPTHNGTFQNRGNSTTGPGATSTGLAENRPDITPNPTTPRANRMNKSNHANPNTNREKQTNFAAPNMNQANLINRTHPNPTPQRTTWTSPGTQLAKTNPPAPKFISAADSLLHPIRSGKTTAPAGIKKPSVLALSAGISLEQSIPIREQQLSTYNLLSDYLPSPYISLHIGQKWYLRTAPRFNSAQYTRPQLIDSSGGDTSHIPGYPQYLQYDKITLKKLYYTDIPLTIHYRVVQGLYLGAGIQYSRLWQAAGEDRTSLHPSNGLGSDTLFSSKIVGLKNNASAYSKLAASDWRLVFEADYAWRRFTFGLQYQRGLNTYLPANASGSAGTDKNSSFSIHAYYDLWDQRSKKH